MTAKDQTVDVRGNPIVTFYCSCGMTVRGNGARTSHRRKHFKAGDGHRFLTEAQWKALP